jgi:hypothetical protein
MNLFEALISELEAEAKALAARVETLPVQERIDALNRIRLALHQVSPLKNEPVDCVLWLPEQQVEPNDYNPNAMAPPEMRLLKRSTDKDGYTQPVVAGWEGKEIEWSEDITYRVTDGEHRSTLPKKDRATRERLHGRLPVVVLLGKTRNEQIAATIRHNRARGVHGVLPMTDIVAEMIKNGWADDEIAKELGMDADEVLRFKHNSGMPELFKAHQYSRSWE